MKKNYLQLVDGIIAGQIDIHAFVEAMGVNRNEIEKELERLNPITYTKTSVPKPIYFFKGCDYPHLLSLFHCSKLFSFAEGGSPYKKSAISKYDLRTRTPYVQAAVYDPDTKVFPAGLRFLPLYKGIPFHRSAMNKVVEPTQFIIDIMPRLLELGQTFVLPNTGKVGGFYLLSAMAAMIVLNPSASLLCGKPTIAGTMPIMAKQIVSSFMYDAFPGTENEKLNPSKQELFSPANGIIVPQVLPFEKIIREYNRSHMHTNAPHVLYPHHDRSVYARLAAAGRMLSYYEVAIPPMISFYSSLTKRNGMMALNPLVINPDYSKQAWELPIILDPNDIDSIHKIFVEHYKKILTGSTYDY